MRRLYFLLLVVFPLLVVAKNNEKDFIRLIKEHDVPVAARNLPESATLEDFWRIVVAENNSFINFYNDIMKRKGAENEAIEAIENLMAIDYKLFVDIVPEFSGYCDTLAIDMGLAPHPFELNVIDDPTPNAFTVMAQKGFAICISTGLLYKLNYDYAKIMGVVAHEFAHGAYMHHLQTEYEAAKKKRRDRILGGLEAGLTAISQVADAYSSSITGSDYYDASKYAKHYKNISDRIKKTSFIFKYKYMREEELEADLVAFRFMQQFGWEDKYIEMLQTISSSDDYFWYNEDESDHPSTAYRIKFLNFVANNPQYYSEVELKQQKNKKAKTNSRTKNRPDKADDPLYD